jgi:hypothetical protein
MYCAFGQVLTSGLGKTVEAIALSLLHRHPLSAPRPRAIAQDEGALHEGSELLPGSGSSRKATQASGAMPTMKIGVGPPGMEDETLSSWWEGEKKAFKDSSAFDEQAQIRVAQVAVGPTGISWLSLGDLVHTDLNTSTDSRQL